MRPVRAQSAPRRAAASPSVESLRFRKTVARAIECYSFHSVARWCTISHANFAWGMHAFNGAPAEGVLTSCIARPGRRLYALWLLHSQAQNTCVSTGLHTPLTAPIAVRRSAKAGIGGGDPCSSLFRRACQQRFFLGGDDLAHAQQRLVVQWCGGAERS